MSSVIPGSIQADGFISALGGMDAGRSPNLINPNQYANGVNVTCQDGFPATRPGFLHCEQRFSVDSIQPRFQTGNPQGMKYYQVGSNGYLVIAAGGRIFVVDPQDGFTTYDLTPETGPNSTQEPKVYMCQAEEYFIIQDGSSKPIILTGLTSSRAGANQVPVGTAMAYGWGRLWVARGNEFVAGDINGGPTPLTSFTESQYFAEGGAFRLPSSCGQLTGMTFIPLQDTTTGQGQLLVGGEYGIASVNGGIPRAQWKETQIQQIAQLDVGFAGQDGNALLNGDVFYRAFDGIRSYRMARAQQGINGNTPQSNEVQPYVNTDTQELLKFSSAVYFNGRILITTNPSYQGSYCYWRGLLSLNSQPQSQISSKSPPVWEGVWTGLNIVQITKGVFNKRERCFALVRNVNNEKIATINQIIEQNPEEGLFQFQVQDTSLFTEGETYMDLQNKVHFTITDIVNDTLMTIQTVNIALEEQYSVGDVLVKGEYNEIWEVSRDSPFDVYQEEKRRIQSKLWTRSFDHQSPFSQKKLTFGAMWASDVIGTVNWTISYRPDQYPCMLPWKFGEICSQMEVCGEQCPTLLTRHPGYQTKFKLGCPDGSCLPQTDEAKNLGYQFQWLIEWEGYMKLRGVQEICNDITEDTKANC